MAAPAIAESYVQTGRPMSWSRTVGVGCARRPCHGPLDAYNFRELSPEWLAAQDPDLGHLEGAPGIAANAGAVG